MPHLTVNGKSYDIDADPNTPLLWAVAGAGRANGHQIRLRHCAMRSVHRARRRCCCPFLLSARERG